jgi:hypothetical protein
LKSDWSEIWALDFQTSNLKPQTLKMSLIIRLKYFFEKHGFNAASRLADKLGMRASSVRIFFIYISFVTAGLWFGVYLTLAFWIRLKDLIRAKRSSVFDL